jgi:hypothetical protein
MEPDSTDRELEQPLRRWFFVRGRYASLICLPAGLFLLIGAVAGHGRHVARARPALYVGVGTLFIVVAFLIFQRIGDAMGWG